MGKKRKKMASERQIKKVLCEKKVGNNIKNGEQKIGEQILREDEFEN